MEGEGFHLPVRYYISAYSAEERKWSPLLSSSYLYLLSSQNSLIMEARSTWLGKRKDRQVTSVTCPNENPGYQSHSRIFFEHENSKNKKKNIYYIQDTWKLSLRLSSSTTTLFLWRQIRDIFMKAFGIEDYICYLYSRKRQNNIFFYVLRNINGKQGHFFSLSLERKTCLFRKTRVSWKLVLYCLLQRRVISVFRSQMVRKV